MTESAKHVIVGGGVLGCAVAYHLVNAGENGIVVVDQGDIAGGTTSQGAGLIGQVRGTVELSRLIMRTRKVIDDLCARSLDCGWHAVGSLRLSLAPARDEEFDRLYLTAKKADLRAEVISHAEALKLFPGLILTGVRRILWCPGDGYVSAPQLAMAYSTAARDLGVEFATHTQVLGFDFDSNRSITGIRTPAGTMRARTVVVAAGAMAGRVAELAGLKLPIFPVRHQSVVTTPLPGVHANLPVVRIPDARIYFRPDGSSALLGAFTESCLAQDPGNVGDSYPRAKQDAVEIQGMFAAGQRFLPALAGAGISEVRKGLPTGAPDGTSILGPVPGMAGLYLLAACQAHGVAGSGGLAGLLVDAILHGKLPPAAAAFDPARWMGQPWEERQARQASERILQNYYDIHGPE